MYVVVRLSFSLQNPTDRLTVLSSARTTILQGQNCKLHSAGGGGGEVHEEEGNHSAVIQNQVSVLFYTSICTGPRSAADT